MWGGQYTGAVSSTHAPPSIQAPASNPFNLHSEQPLSMDALTPLHNEQELSEALFRRLSADSTHVNTSDTSWATTAPAEKAPSPGDDVGLESVAKRVAALKRQLAEATDELHQLTAITTTTTSRSPPQVQKEEVVPTDCLKPNTACELDNDVMRVFSVS